MRHPLRQVRAQYDADTITVYQAYNAAIADAALRAGRFVEPFKTTRMTWIKPSFLWMMYRCGWATKPDQERVLAIRMTRDGFEEALAQSSWTHFDPSMQTDHEAWRGSIATNPVRVQWDPERTPTGEALPHRSLQVGLAGEQLQRYIADWICEITDITAALPDIKKGLAPAPDEQPYPLPLAIAQRVGTTKT